MSLPATITLNGAPHPIEGAMPLDALLETLGLAGTPVVVERNELFGPNLQALWNPLGLGSRPAPQVNIIAIPDRVKGFAPKNQAVHA